MLRATSPTPAVTLTALTFSPRSERLFRTAEALPDLCELGARERLHAAGADGDVVSLFRRRSPRVSPQRFAGLVAHNRGI